MQVSTQFLWIVIIFVSAGISPRQHLFGNPVICAARVASRLFCSVVPANLREHSAPTKSIILLKIGRKSFRIS